MIDLHSHTTESDGTLSPAELVDAALTAGLEALAISDHDTLTGFDEAVPYARQRGLDLVCGIELSTKLNGKTVHLLGYFLWGSPSGEFRTWLHDMQESRRDRNRRLAVRLQELGLDITLEEVEQRGGRMTGRPHFAKVMKAKGYVPTIQAAFDDYLDESAKGYVDRLEPQLKEGIERIVQGGGIASIAHPVRIAPLNQLRDLVAGMAADGMRAIEVYHSDHGPDAEAELMALAQDFNLRPTGGSDFHGDVKPNIQLGTGPGHLRIPKSVLDRLREPL